MTASIPGTMASIPYDAASRFGDRPAQRVKRDGAWQDISFAQLRGIADEIARGLVALGVRAGDRVCILADTRAEWLQVQLGCAAAGAIVVPIYPSNSPEECEWVIGNSGAVVVICENAAQVAKVAKVRAALPELRHVIVIDPDGANQTLDGLRESGRAGDPGEILRRVAALAPDDPALIIYTSGTTGRPKGCVLTHRNLMSTCDGTAQLDLVRAGEVGYLFLPLAHVFAQVVNLDLVTLGGVTAYCSAGAAGIIADLGEVRPHLFPSVPRIFEKIYAQFAEAHEAEADPELSAKVRGLFGGRVRVAVSGAAPIAPQILEFFHAAGVPVYEGYGLSESTASGTLNHAGATRIGTIGRPIPGCEVRMEADGELLMRGAMIFAGYWRNPEATAETVVDGWLRTGDLAAIDQDGFVRITGRKKDIIITAGGKNLTPSEIENDLCQSPLVSCAVMYGDRRPYPVALITLDVEHVLPWARARQLPADLAELAGHEQLRAAIQEVLDRVNARYAKVAQIKRFAILDHDFSQETGELTPTLKIKRQVISEKYAAVFDRLYAGPR